MQLDHAANHALERLSPRLVQIIRDAKDRQDRDAAAAERWQADKAAKEDAQIAAALARQQRIQAELEQVGDVAPCANATCHPC